MGENHDKTANCSKCTKIKNKDEFEEGRLCCRKCNEYNVNHRAKNKERYNEEQRRRFKEDEEYRKKKQEAKKERSRNIVSCDVCNRSMRQDSYYQHLKTNKHKRNLEMKQAEEN